MTRANPAKDYLEAPRTFGTTTNSPYCPVRDTDGDGIARNVVWLLEVMNAADEAAQDEDGHREQRILARKAIKYRLLNRWLHDPVERLSEETVFALLIIGNRHWRVEDHAARNPHWEAATDLIRLRGGNKGFRVDPGISISSKPTACQNIRLSWRKQCLWARNRN